MHTLIDIASEVGFVMSSLSKQISKFSSAHSRTVAWSRGLLAVIVMVASLGHATVVTAQDDGRLQRIVSGTASAGYPWMAAILNANIDDNFDAFYCGASMVTDEWLLTAAHCVEKRPDGVLPPWRIDVLVGVTDLRDPNAIRYQASEVVMHPDYLRHGYPDLALVRLSGPATNEVISIASPGNALEQDGLEVQVAGWGLTDYFAWRPERFLRETFVPLVNHDVCESSYEFIESIFQTHMICAGDDTAQIDGTNRDSCSGDSGGPLFSIDENTGDAIQLGVVSFGEECGLEDFPGVYARVSTFKEWIDAVTLDEGIYPTPVGTLDAAYDVVCTGLICSVDGSSSPEGGAAIVEYKWSFGDGSREYGSSVSHEFEEAGDYRVRLDVRDASGEREHIVRTLRVFDSESASLRVCDVFKGRIFAAGEVQYQPDAAGFAASASTIRATLASRATNLNLTLQRFNVAQGFWENIVTDAGAGSSEHIRHRAASSGQWRWRVNAKVGTGPYRLDACFKQ